MTLADRVNLLHQEIGRLAHASPPPSGREAAIHQLKARVTVLRYEEYGIRTRPIREGLRQGGAFAVFGLLVGVLRPLVAAALGRPPQAQELGRGRMDARLGAMRIQVPEAEVLGVRYIIECRLPGQRSCAATSSAR